MKQEFQKPILSSIYEAIAYILGGLGVTIAIIAIIAGVVQSEFSLVMYGLGVLLVVFLCALPLIGIAQLISYIGKTAYYSEAISDSLAISMHETSKTLGEISRRLQASTLREVTSNSPAKPSSGIGAICPYCNAQLPAGKVRKGENFCPHCNNSFIAE